MYFQNFVLAALATVAGTVAFGKRLSILNTLRCSRGLRPVTQRISGDKPLQSSVTVDSHVVTKRVLTLESFVA